MEEFFKPDVVCWRLFNKFLLENHCLTKYWFNLNYQYIKNHSDFLIVPLDYIMNGFLWVDTLEGHEYWKKMHEKWLQRYYHFLNNH